MYLTKILSKVKRHFNRRIIISEIYYFVKLFGAYIFLKKYLQ